MYKLVLTAAIFCGVFVVGNLLASSSSVPTIEKVTLSEEERNLRLNNYMYENVYERLQPLVNESPINMFARCISGFSHQVDENNSLGNSVMGTITYYNGCSEDPNIHFSFVFNVKNETFRIKRDTDRNYVSLDEFVGEEPEANINNI